jgi:hypothetical protein
MIGVSLNFALVLGYFVFLIGGFALHSRTVDHSWLFLLRSFFPKWQFFHSLGQTPRLHYRHQTADEWSEWRKFTPRARRSPSQLFYNPHVNLALAEQNLVELLVQDLVACADGAAAPQLVSYRMVDRLARAKAGDVSACVAYQFRVCLERPGEASDFDADTILLSPIMPAKEWES